MLIIRMVQFTLYMIFFYLLMHIYHVSLYYTDFDHIYGVTQTTTPSHSDVYLTKNEFMPLYATWWLLIMLCQPVYEITTHTPAYTTESNLQSVI